jgi:4'-phosphopantetheinyl transferase
VSDRRPQPRRGLVEVWRVELVVGDEVLADHRRDLNEVERARADRFVVETPRRQLTVTRSVLRRLLGAALDRDPRSLQFEYGDDGKPSLAGGELAFNVSHSHGRALIAIAAEGTLGVDLEKVRHEVRHERVGERYFSLPEREVLRALPEREKPEAFFRCWARKEAWLKAKGTGLRLPLAGFDVTLAPGEPPRLLATRFDDEEASRWTLLELDAGAGFEAALAWLGEPPELAEHRWPEP